MFSARLPVKSLFVPILVALPLAAQSHHSPFGMQQTSTVLEGELVEVNWRNPHASFRLAVVDAVGNETIWNMEANSLFNLERAGITRDSFPIGERVKVVGRASMRADDYRMLAINMFLLDGRELMLWGNVFSQYNDAPNLQDAESENLGFFRQENVEVTVDIHHSPKKLLQPRLHGIRWIISRRAVRLPVCLR